jgi:aminomethyltransferase
MPSPTPFSARTHPLCTSYAFKEWAGKVAVRAYDTHSEREYTALRHSAGLLDVSPLYKYDIQGPDAAVFASRVWCRDVCAMKSGAVRYSAMANSAGQCLDDGTISRLGPFHFRFSTSEPWMHWWHTHSRGFDVRIEDMTERLCALAVQGPMARRILRPLVAWNLDKMRFFRIRETTFVGDIPVTISRTGYTGDLGYELWMAPEHALQVWDAIVEEGAPLGLEPVGLDALDVVRIEAGFVMQGVDYQSARHCITAHQRSTPHEAGLGWTVDLDRDPFIGQGAIAEELIRGPAWALVGLELDWAELETVYAAEGLPPHLAPVACRSAVPIYDLGGHNQVGQVTSSVWSPLLKRYLALGQVLGSHRVVGAKLRVEHTPEFHRRQVTARVVETPFFDPERKRGVISTPREST